MKILLAFDEKIIIDKEKLTKLVQEKTTFLEFELCIEGFTLPEGLITTPETFKFVFRQFEAVKNNYQKIFCFTLKQYIDNFFFHEYDSLVIMSFFGWEYLTDLPMSNGTLYFIIDYLAMELDHTDFIHNETTGCIYDFLGDKKGIDDGMRQARFCSNCLKRISKSLVRKEDIKIFNDLQTLMNHLSEASRWNKDILTSENPKSNLIIKRKPKNINGIQVVIASPGDTDVERKLLLNSLEVRFRRDNHENYCGYRIIVNGWECLASQPGYAQDIINKIIDESDFVVAVFRHKLGTPTRDTESGTVRSESGTAEELLRALDKTKKNHPIGMAYFFSEAPTVSLGDPEWKKTEKEWGRLSEFKEKIKDKMIYKSYTNEEELLSIVLNDLTNNIKSYIIKK
jgi:hypothetical protein